MSNRFDDDPFDDDDDLFGDDDFDDLEDFGNGGDDSFRDAFDDDDAFADDFGDDADLFGGGFDDEDDPFADDFADDEEETGGPSRTFIYIAGAMIALFVIALIVLVVITLGNDRPSDIELTATAITILNSTTIAQSVATSTASFEMGLTQTVQANLTATELARPTDTPTPSPSPTVITPTPDLTEAAAFAFGTQTQQAVFAAETQAALPSSTPVGPPTIEVNAVALTATALAGLLQPTVIADGSGGGEIASPTPEGGSVGPLPTALPDTGLFDDLAASGGGGLGGLALAVLGLLGVIVISRRLRTANQ